MTIMKRFILSGLHISLMPNLIKTMKDYETKTHVELKIITVLLFGYVSYQKLNAFNVLLTLSTQF